MKGVRPMIAVLLLAGGFGFAALGLVRLPAFGHYPGPYGDLVNAVGVKERHATNMVTLVNFDYRGFDTIGEEYMLFAAVTGVILLLRGHRGEEISARPSRFEERPIPERSEAVTLGARLVIGLIVIFGLYIVFHAQLTPGGGFQGGAIIGSAMLLLYLGEGYRSWRRLMRSAILDAVEALGTGAFALAGLAPMAVGAAFLQNLLPLGQTGNLPSAGVIPLINIAVGVAVSTGFALLFLEFLEETREPDGEDDS